MINEWLPLALSVGVTEKEFPLMCPSSLAPYLKSHELKQREKLEELNLQSWLTGIYVGHAIACAFSENCTYPDKPFDLYAKSESTELQSRREAEIFAAYANEYNRSMRKEEK